MKNVLTEDPERAQLRLKWSKLMDLYGDLLPDRQREFLALHYNEDLSLSEIADMYHITRQAVHDAVNKGKRSLGKYEEHLHLDKRTPVDHHDQAPPWLERSTRIIHKIQFDLQETPLYDNSKVMKQLTDLETLLKEASEGSSNQ